MTKLYILQQLGDNVNFGEDDVKRLRYYTSIKALVEHETRLNFCKMPALVTLYRWSKDDRKFYQGGNYHIFKETALGTGD